MRYLFVVGPWGSGTSAVAGVCAALGCAELKPTWQIDDSRTPDTHESVHYRALLRDLIDEQSLAFRDPDRASRLAAFREQLEGVASTHILMLKHPLSALLLPEIEVVFAPIFLFVTRAADSIEQTRRRRGWDERYAPDRTQQLANAMRDFEPRSTTRLLWLSYERLVADPGATVAEIAAFIGLGTPADQLRACASIRQISPASGLDGSA